MSMHGKRRDIPTRYEPGFLRELDRRTDLYQRLNAAHARIVADAGGETSLSHLKLMLVERFVFLSEMLERWELDIVTERKGAAELLSRWVQAVNSLQGLARAIGIEVKAKRGPSLKSYVEGKTA